MSFFADARFMSSCPELTVVVEQLADPVPDADDGGLDRFSQMLAVVLRRGLSTSMEFFLVGSWGATFAEGGVACVRF